MADTSKTSSDSKSSGFSRIFVWIMGILSFGLLVFLVAVVHQFVAPSPAPKLLLVQDIPLPSGLGRCKPWSYKSAGTRNSTTF